MSQHDHEGAYAMKLPGNYVHCKQPTTLTAKRVPSQMISLPSLALTLIAIGSGQHRLKLQPKAARNLASLFTIPPSVCWWPRWISSWEIQLNGGKTQMQLFCRNATARLVWQQSGLGLACGPESKWWVQRLFKQHYICTIIFCRCNILAMVCITLASLQVNTPSGLKSSDLASFPLVFDPNSPTSL